MKCEKPSSGNNFTSRLLLAPEPLSSCSLLLQRGWEGQGPSAPLKAGLSSVLWSPGYLWEPLHWFVSFLFPVFLSSGSFYSVFKCIQVALTGHEDPLNSSSTCFFSSPLSFPNLRRVTYILCLYFLTSHS